MIETKFKKHIILDIKGVDPAIVCIYFQFIIFSCDVPSCATTCGHAHDKFTVTLPESTRGFVRQSPPFPQN